MIQPHASIDIRDSLAYLDNVKSEIGDKALVRALNQTAAQAKVQASREIRASGYKVKAATVKASIAIVRANSTTLRAIVAAKGKRIGLVEYSPRQTKAGVTVAVKAGRKLVRHAFLTTLSGGHRGVFARVLIGSKRASRLPIEELFGPSIPQAFANATVQNALITGVRDRFPRILAKEVNFLQLKSS